MSNITDKSNYIFEINFEYPDPYGMDGKYHPFNMSAEVVETNVADAWYSMEEQWKKKYDLTLVKTATIVLVIKPVEEVLPPAA